MTGSMLLKSSRRDSQMSEAQGSPKFLLQRNHVEIKKWMQILQQVTTMEIPAHQNYSGAVPCSKPPC
ncbi:2-isopropylmalate synthase [Dissostichus eleginoides]|uniref:2-isopropylmalate synthase n=1 Tax=Dissostichus eleginoides TaxID=100907 RepID=A0AAD9FDY5_DISEL|nr:2-isopropylmalate synthase [Dissostichus eleginoides]